MLGRFSSLTSKKHSVWVSLDQTIGSSLLHFVSIKVWLDGKRILMYTLSMSLFKYTIFGYACKYHLWICLEGIYHMYAKRVYHVFGMYPSKVYQLCVYLQSICVYSKMVCGGDMLGICTYGRKLCVDISMYHTFPNVKILIRITFYNTWSPYFYREIHP